MNKKKCFAALSSAAISLVIAGMVTTNAHAAVKSYIVNDNGRIISFNLDSLLTDYAQKLSGASAPMFDQYMKYASGLVAFQDDKKGFVSSDAVMQAYTDALVAGKGSEFKLDTVTENAAASDIKSLTVGYQAGTDGTIIAAVKATVEQAGTQVAGKTVVVASLPSGTDATQYSVTVNGQAMTYDASTGKFTGTLDGTYTIQELQEKIVVSLNQSNNSEDFDVDQIY